MTYQVININDSLLGPPVIDLSHFGARSSLMRVADLKPLEYVIENLLVKGYLYTLTARNNHGKTTLAVLMAATVSKGDNFGANRTKQGRVLLLSGENAYDTDLKLRALGDRIDLDQVDVLDGSFEMRLNWPHILSQNSHYIYDLVICDSLQSYFVDGDPNSNAEAKEHVKAFRNLSKLPGNPTVVVLAHPVKNPDPSNLVPYGGGSIINEIDTNLTLNLVDGVATLSHTKLRQSSFPEMKFELVIDELDGMENNFGGKVTSSRFEAIDYVSAQKMEDEAFYAREKLIKALLAGGGSKSFLARDVFGDDTGESTSRIQRMINILRKEKIVTPAGAYALTPHGRKVAKNEI
jgi:hypothetical protein